MLLGLQHIITCWCLRQFCTCLMRCDVFYFKPGLGCHALSSERLQSRKTTATRDVSRVKRASVINTSSFNEREMFYLTTHSTHFIYGYMASDILWLRTILIVRKETRCRHIGYSFRLTARVLLYAPSHRQDSTYHGLCYTSRGALAGTRNSSMGSFNMLQQHNYIIFIIVIY